MCRGARSVHEIADSLNVTNSENPVGNACSDLLKVKGAKDDVRCLGSSVSKFNATQNERVRSVQAART